MRTPWEVLADLERDAMRGLSVRAWADLAQLNGRCAGCGALHWHRMRHKPWVPGLTSTTMTAPRPPNGGCGAVAVPVLSLTASTVHA